MTFVYAIGRPHQLTFRLTSDRDTIPLGASVYAVCAGEECFDSLDENTFHAMSDEEYQEFQALITEAHRLEAARAHFGQKRPEGLVRSLFSWILERTFSAGPVSSLKRRRASKAAPEKNV